MNDKQLFEQYISEMRFKSKEELLKTYEDKQNEISKMVEINLDSSLGRACEVGLGIVGWITNKEIWEVMDFGLIEAFKNKNMKALHEALFTYNRLSFFSVRFLLGIPNNDGNEYLVCRNIIESFAACDVKAIEKCCQNNVPILTKGYKLWFVGYNIILGLLYNDKKRLDKGIQQAEKTLKNKLPKFEIAIITYLLAIAKENIEIVNEQFSVIMGLYKKSGLLENQDQFLKIFALLPHGLYNMAHYFLSEKNFNKIVPPKGTAFWNEFSLYQKSVGFTNGEPYIRFNGKLEYLNLIYE